MLPKPDTCQGCPLYGDGQGIVPDRVRSDTRVMLVGQNPGADEEVAGEPFVGKAGQLMESRYLALAGLTRDTVSIGNAFRCRVGIQLKGGRWRKDNSLPDPKTLAAAVEHCSQYDPDYEQFDLVVCLGEVPMRKFGVTGKVHEWRGYLK